MKLVIFFFFFCVSTVSFGEVKFSQKKIRIKDKTLIVEVADDAAKLAQGLMFRKKLERDRGMIFIFPNEQQRSFWMKNTLIPLSIGFFNKSRELREVADLDPPGSVLLKQIPTYSSKFPAQYVLEVNKGWFKKNKIKLGQKFYFIK